MCTSISLILCISFFPICCTYIFFSVTIGGCPGVFRGTSRCFILTRKWWVMNEPNRNDVLGRRSAERACAPGERSTFARDLAREHAARNQERGRGMRESRGKSILLVEDNASVADALVLLLVEAGYHVEVWVQETTFHFQRPFPDLILLDLLLGGIDGQTICQQLKGRGTTRRIPVILMSANQQTPRIAREVGADAWIMKPFEAWSLFALLDRYLDQRRLIFDQEAPAE